MLEILIMSFTCPYSFTSRSMFICVCNYFCTLLGIKNLFLAWQEALLYMYQASVCQTTVRMPFAF